jgi:flagellar protein FlaG
MDEVRITGSPPASQLVRRAGKQTSPDASIVEKSSDTAGKSDAQPAADQAQVQEQEQAAQDRRAQIESAVKRLNEYVQSIQRGLKFDYDEEVSQTVITVVDRSTNEVIRQIPDEVALELARSLSADSTFSLLNVKA